MAEHFAYKDREWERQPAAEAFLRSFLANGLGGCPTAARYSDRLLDLCGVRLRDLLDHIEFEDPIIAEVAERSGWQKIDGDIWENPHGYFPAFVKKGDGTAIVFRVESVAQFLAANGIEEPIQGVAHGPTRRAVAFRGEDLRFEVVERNGYPAYDIPDVAGDLVRRARLHLQAFRSRRRHFDTVEQGLAHTEALVDAAVAALGQHWACDLWLKAEREYWMVRCPAAQLQKARQDEAGIGWCNIDHHTYDGSRRHFRHTIRILEKLGYELREMLYAGELAGWGSQILEQPVLKSTIFADVDLAPHELDVDFAHDELPELDRHRRAGLVSALHGESILEAGLNHVAFLYEQGTLRAQLTDEGVRMMQPFSDMPHLYQELTEGSWAPVDPAKVDALEALGHLDAAQAEDIRLNGAILSHLENIERNEGYKGFNKPGIDGVLRKLDPRARQAAAASTPRATAA